ncbi:hypothetical protein GP486_006281 [Trichoglossum hirsutum]|uniref:Fungal-type protein kinase domain-containing protein n=1 Tax=Trichoglossum hirsutum TaxID=265104 RepID=A0A9P8IIT4_9PEZI|nr:hypothetical protein GP486_006281 [Trichoglossum hirsutum]
MKRAMAVMEHVALFHQLRIEIPDAGVLMMEELVDRLSPEHHSLALVLQDIPEMDSFVAAAAAVVASGSSINDDDDGENDSYYECHEGNDEENSYSEYSDEYDQEDAINNAKSEFERLVAAVTRELAAYHREEEEFDIDDSYPAMTTTPTTATPTDAAATAETTLAMETPDVVKFIRSGEPGLSSRELGQEPDDAWCARFGPDFFTSSVQYNPSTERDDPFSFSTIINPHLFEPRDTAKPDFAWEDVRDIWEFGASPEDYHDWAKLMLKASEVLRLQWHREYVLAFLISGTYLRMFRISRSCVLVSTPVDFADNEDDFYSRITLAKCILTQLLLPHTAAGFPIDHSQARTITDERGRPHLIVTVDDLDIVLGEQIVWPRKDCPVARATTVHLARRINDSGWTLCYKSSWPEKVRIPEGAILSNLQGLSGVVKLLAWDAPFPVGLVYTEHEVRESFRPLKLSMIRVEPSDSQTEEVQNNNRQEDWWANSTPNRNRRRLTSSEQRSGLTIREHRRTVTDYLPHSLGNTVISLTDTLMIWQSLYTVVHSIAVRGWVHRDLSWSNVRLRHDGVRYWVTLIDFDLAAPILGPTDAPTDKTGTPMFMPLEILWSSPNSVCRHQELHEFESVFWIGFLALINRTTEGRRSLNETARHSPPRIARQKSEHVSVSARADWRSWFGESRDMRLLVDMMDEVVDVHFRSRYFIIYPRVDDYTSSGERKHVEHYQVVLLKATSAINAHVNYLVKKEFRSLTSEDSEEDS